MQDLAPQDSCLWALTMQSWAEIFFIFFILIVYLQNRFQQLKSIYGLMEKAAVGGFLALKEWEPHQWQREESIDYVHKTGQGTQGKQRWLTGVFAESSSKEPGSASKLPGSGGQIQYFIFVQRNMLNRLRGTKWLQQRVLSFQGCSFLDILHSFLVQKLLQAFSGPQWKWYSPGYMVLGHLAQKVVWKLSSKVFKGLQYTKLALYGMAGLKPQAVSEPFQAKDLQTNNVIILILWDSLISLANKEEPARQLKDGKANSPLQGSWEGLSLLPHQQCCAGSGAAVCYCLPARQPGRARWTHCVNPLHLPQYQPC